MTDKVKFVYAFPGRNVPANTSLLNARALVELAVLAESVGFSAVSLDDHPIPPESWRQDPSGHDGIDPFSGLAAVAAATRDIRLFVNAAVVPYRNPFLLAKAASSLDVLSEGRLMMALVAGYLPAEAAALGVDFATRSETMDEAIQAMKLAWRGEPVTYRGRNFNAEAVTAYPPTVQRPHPPLFIGGSSQASLRRVVEHANGWAAAPNPRSRTVSRHTPPLETIDEYKGYVARIRQMAADAGRTEPITLMLLSVGQGAKDPSERLAAIQEFHDIARPFGATPWSSHHGTADSLDDCKREIERFGDEVLAKL